MTGGVQVERAGLSFESGEALYTRTLNPRRGGELIAAGGDSYSAVALASSGALVELRRVTDQYTPMSERSVCAGHAQYVALVHDQQSGGVVVLVFAGAEPPGPYATESQLCGAYRYTAPDGARTRQGVALW